MLGISCILLSIAGVIALGYILYLKRNIHKYESIIANLLFNEMKNLDSMSKEETLEYLDQILEENKGEDEDDK